VLRIVVRWPVKRVTRKERILKPAVILLNPKTLNFLYQAPKEIYMVEVRGMFQGLLSQEDKKHCPIQKIEAVLQLNPYLWSMMMEVYKTILVLAWRGLNQQ